jgi:hypothetical protein
MNQFAGHHRVADHCGCFDGHGAMRRSALHVDPQARDNEAWHQLIELIDQTAKSGATSLAPGTVLGPHIWKRIVTLPASIATLTEVTHLNLYGSNLRSIPPEIGDMTALTRFEPYTSHRLHWFPYEIRRCKALIHSTVSTRALFGNVKYRSPFPQLPATPPADSIPSRCSVCLGAFGETGVLQRWISLRIATDVLPLLVHACSLDCLDALPSPPPGYVGYPHEGGTELTQPERDFYRPRTEPSW